MLDMAFTESCEGERCMADKRKGKGVLVKVNDLDDDELPLVSLMI
jgi:hypothetical protein